MSEYFDPGARWLACDLHVHTPWDAERTFGENVQHAMEALKKGEPRKLTEIASHFIEACQQGAGGEGLDLVALTDHNSIEGYRVLKPYLDAVGPSMGGERGKVPVVLPGVEFSVGGERPLHFLVIFAASTGPDEVDHAIRHVFGAHECFDPQTGTPRATGNSVDEFLRKLHEYCRPTSGERNLAFVVIPAHADSSRGVDGETVRQDQLSVATTIWDEMGGHLRQWVITRQDWNGFQTVRPYAELPEAFRALLAQWVAARRGFAWDDLDARERTRIRDAVHWPLIECSDPHRYEQVGAQYTWLKMEVPDVEGIRLALLDPESRLRRSADSRPGQTYPFIRSVRIRRTDFLEDINVPLNPCLNTLIGGRGSGKSTVFECLRYVLDRARPEDFDEGDETSSALVALLTEKDVRDFGETPGILLPDHEIVTEFVVAGRSYQAVRTAGGGSVSPEGEDESAALDIRSLIAPRILSQRQISRIASNPAAQRRELDALVDAEAMRSFTSDRRDALLSLEALQSTRRDLKERVANLPARETALRTVRDQIAFLERGGNKEILETFTRYQAEEHWLAQAATLLENNADHLEAEGAQLGETDVPMAAAPDGPTSEWTATVSKRISEAVDATKRALIEQAATLRLLNETVTAEKATEWLPGYGRAREAYDELRHEMTERGVEFNQHEPLILTRASLEEEVADLRRRVIELEELEGTIRQQREAFVELHEARLALRRALAQSLEENDADIRLDLLAFGDRADLADRREEWFGGAGIQERDWELLVAYVFSPNGSLSDRLKYLVDAIRQDIDTFNVSGLVVGHSESKTAELLGDAGSRLTRNFFNALQRGDRMHLDEVERFLPEDSVLARVRGVDGTFKPIEQGSIGQRSTAILALLLTAGEQPLLIDQPEDDLDNQYVYDVVVDLLRKRKFSRQIVIATHNANIPVNGDAELITALGVEDRLGRILTAGSIDRQDVKDVVATIMEGSAEAFRLRRERYGY